MGKGKINAGGQIRVDQPSMQQTDTQELGPAISIEGRIYKPSVFYVLARGSLNYTGLELTQNFVPRIWKDAFKRPF